MKKEKSDERRVITTAKMPRKEIAEVPESALTGGGFIASKDGGKLDDGEFVRRYATTTELEGLRRLIEERRQARPKFSYWRCSNVKCRWEGKLSGDFDADAKLPCFSCNCMRIVEKDGGGWLKRLTSPDEIKAFEEKAARLDKEAVLRLKRARFAEVNHQRGLHGSKALSWQEFTTRRAG